MFNKKKPLDVGWFDILIRYFTLFFLAFAFYFLFFNRSAKEVLNHAEQTLKDEDVRFSKPCIPVLHSDEKLYQLSVELQTKAIQSNLTTITAIEINNPSCVFVSNVFTKNKEYLFYVNPKITSADGLNYVDIKHPQCEVTTVREKYYTRVSIEYMDRKLNKLSDKCSTAKCRIEVVQAINLLSGNFQCPQ